LQARGGLLTEALCGVEFEQIGGVNGPVARGANHTVPPAAARYGRAQKDIR